MQSFKFYLLNFAAAQILILGNIQCNKTVPEDSEESTATAAASEPKAKSAAEIKAEEEAAKAAALLDYPKRYCENVGKLKIRTNIDERLSYICKGNTPTKEFLNLRSKALAQKPGEIELTTLKTQHNEETQKSEFLIVWSFFVPLRPMDVKNKPIYEFVSKGYSSDSITLGSVFNRLPETTLEPGGLHLWSVNLTHDLVIKGTSNLTLASKRNTQYNLYQVLSGDEEMGLGIEHLTDTDNASYGASTMVNFSFNEGKGYNNGVGGTVVVTMLHFILANSGFPQTAADSIAEIAKHTADGMYNGLKE